MPRRSEQMSSRPLSLSCHSPHLSLFLHVAIAPVRHSLSAATGRQRQRQRQRRNNCKPQAERTRRGERKTKAIGTLLRGNRFRWQGISQSSSSSCHSYGGGSAAAAVAHYVRQQQQMPSRMPQHQLLLRHRTILMGNSRGGCVGKCVCRVKLEKRCASIDRSRLQAGNARERERERGQMTASIFIDKQRQLKPV